MTKVLSGLYRVPGRAYVTDGMMTFDIREEDYCLKGCVPKYNKAAFKVGLRRHRSRKKDFRAQEGRT